MRLNNAISDLILVDGVAADFTVAGLARQIRALKAAATDVANTALDDTPA